MRISDWSTDVCSSDLRIDLDPDARRSFFSSTLCGARIVVGRDPFRAPAPGAGWRILTRPLHYRRRRRSGNNRRTGHRNHHGGRRRSEENTAELQSLMRIAYAVYCLKLKKAHTTKSPNVCVI